MFDMYGFNVQSPHMWDSGNAFPSFQFLMKFNFVFISIVAGEAPDGTRYKTAYRCEGETMSISCDSSETIQVIRANYGRFSIAICNKHGYTDWSVNCMSHTTTRILQRR